MQGKWLNDESLRLTYNVVRIKREYVDKVNAILLASMEESITFRSPAAMFWTVQKYQVLRQVFDRTLGVLPPNLRSLDTPQFQSCMAAVPAEQQEMVLKGLDEIIVQAQIIKRLYGEWLLNLELGRVDGLERALWKELNRTHENRLQDRDLNGGSVVDDCKLELSSQPAKLSWRRSGRSRRSAG